MDCFKFKFLRNSFVFCAKTTADLIEIVETNHCSMLVAGPYVALEIFLIYPS